MLKYAAVTLALLTTPASAQGEPQFDASLLQTCFDDAEQVRTWEQRPFLESCIGASAFACIETLSFPDADLAALCLNQERDLWAARLADLYENLLIRAAEMDEAIEPTEGAPPLHREQRLREMQDQWVIYRDAACAFEESHWIGGTGVPAAVARCEMSLTAQQYLWLGQYLEEGR